MSKEQVTQGKGPEGRESVVVESIVAGDMLFSDSRRPDVVDLQTLAFGEALRSALRSLRTPRDRLLGRLMFMFDHEGDKWADYLLKEGPLSQKARNYPKLPDLDRSFSRSLISDATVIGVDPFLIEAIPEARLRNEIKRVLEAHPERIAKFRERLVVSDLDSEQPNDPHDEEASSGLEVSRPFVVKCRGVAAALFHLASRTRKGSRPVDLIKAFFQRDAQEEKRVNLSVILDGAVFAQTELGVGAEIRTYFYFPVPSLGANGAVPEQIHLVRAGNVEKIK